MKVRSKAKRFFAILLSLAMVVSMMPTIAFAAGGSPDPGSKLYVKMNTAPEAGDKVIIANTDGNKALNASAGAADITVDGDKITSVGDAAVWTVSGSGSSMTFYNDSSKKYLIHNDTVISHKLSTSNNTVTWTVSGNQMYYKLLNTYYLGYSGTAFGLNTDSNRTIAFYKEYTVAAEPVVSSKLTYDGTAQVLVKGGEGYTLSSTGSDIASIAKSDSGDIKAGDAFAQSVGSYEITAKLDKDYKWADESTDPVPIRVTIGKAAVDVPTAANKTYNGDEQILVTKGTDYILSSQTGAGIDGSGNAVGLNAGDYEFTATLKDSANYEWNDSHIENGFDGKVTASIAPKAATIAPKSDKFTKGESVALTASEDGVCDGDSIGYVILVKDKNGKVINTLDEDGKTYEPVTEEQLKALVVGDYTLSIQLLEDDASTAVQANYNLTTNGTATLKVTPKSSNVKVEDGSDFVENTSGLKFISGTDAESKDCSDEDASGGKLTVEVLSQRDPITPTSEATLVLADNESVIDKFEVNLYLNGVKMNTGSKLNKKIQVQVPVNAKDGVYKIAHWDGTQYEILSDPGVVSGGILTFATDEFSPFVIIGTTTYVKMIGTPADTEKYTVTFDNSYGTVVVDSDGTALSVKDEDYVFTVTAKPGYQIDSVSANGVELTGAGGTYTITAASENSTIVVNASPADVTLTIDNNGTLDTTTYADIPYGVSVNLPGEPARTGYTFGGWHSVKENKTYGAGDPFIPTVNDTLTAVWLADIIVSYAGVTGTVPTDTVVHAGDSFILPEAPTHDDQVFTGWKSANTGMIFAAETLYTPAADDTMTAQWTDKYVITVDPADGSGTTTTNKVAPGSNVTVPAAPARTGYIFGGWYSDANAQTYAPGYLYTPAGNDTLTAQWKQLYTVSYDENGATSGTAPTETAKVEGTVFTVKGSDLALDGYTFAGWKSEVNGVIYQPGDDYTMTAENTTFTAQWTPVATYTVTYSSGEAGLVSTPGGSYLEGAAVEAAAANTFIYADHTFAGWKRSDNGEIVNAADTFNMPAMNITLTAQWEANPATYNVIYDRGSAPGTDPVPTETPKVEGATFTVKATDVTWTGYTFVGWKSNVDNAIYAPGATYTMTAAATTFTAQWAADPATYSVTYDPNGADSGTPPTDTVEKVAGTIFAVKATDITRTGYTFVGWKSDQDHAIYQPGDNYTMTAAATTFEAQWAAIDKYTVTYDKGIGTGSVPSSESNKMEGDEITAANASGLVLDGYNFVGWKRSDNGEIVNAGDVFNMPACNLTLTAQWVAIDKYTVTYNVNGATTIIGDVYAENEEYIIDDVTQPADTAEFAFAGWRNTVDDVVYAHGEKFLMPAQNVTLIATWVEKDAIFHVTYDVDGDTSIYTDSTDYHFNQNVKIKGDYAPTKANYDFVGWKRSDNGDILLAGDNFTMPACNLTLTAQWNAVIKYTVNYELNGGAPAIAADEFLGLSQAKVTDVEPTKTGYKFVGWLNKDTGIEYASGETFTMPETNITLTAQWAKVYTVKFVLNDGGHSGNTTPGDQEVILGDKLTSVGEIQDYTFGSPGVKYYFNGWKNQNGDFWNFEYDTVNEGCFDSTGTMTLTAQWGTEKHYNIVFDDNLTDPLDDYFYYTGSLTKDEVAATDRLNNTVDYPKFYRVDYIHGVDDTQDCDWYLDSACTYYYDVNKSLKENNVEVYVKPDGTLTLYARWTPKYDDPDDVLIYTSEMNTGMYGIYYSDYIEATQDRILHPNPSRVYRNFYLATPDGAISGPGVSELPEGLVLNNRTGEIYGVPTKAGTYTFYVRMANDDKVNYISAVKEITITIEQLPVTIDHKDGNDFIYDKTYGDKEEKAQNLNNGREGLTYVSSNLTFNMKDKYLSESVATELVAASTDATLTVSDADQTATFAFDYSKADAARTARTAFDPANAATLMNASDLVNTATMASKNFTDTVTAPMDRVDGEDADTYKLYLTNDDTLTIARGGDVKPNYAVTVPDVFATQDKTGLTAPNKYLFTINQAELDIDIPTTADYSKFTATMTNCSAICLNSQTLKMQL